MGKLFGNLDASNAETSEDRVGGGFQPIPSGIYDATIKLVYAGKARNSDAQNVTVHLDINGHEHRETVYITNRNGEPTFKDKETGKDVKLPGYQLIDELCMFANEQHITEQEAETKVVKLYNFDEKKELPTEVPVMTALLGKPIKVAIQRVIEDKRKQGSDGQYHPTGETRTLNEMVKVMHPETGRTMNEYIGGTEQPEYMREWTKLNEGKDRNKSTGAANGNTGASGSGTPFGQSQKKSLFGS